MADSPASGHLQTLARAPRPAGSVEEAEARDYCGGELARAGFRVSHEEFGYSAAPGTLGAPAAGIMLSGSLAACALLLLHGRLTTIGVLVLLLLLVGATAVGGWYLVRHGVTGLPIMRRTSTNLVAVRGEPSIWLIAHLDSKSQPIPILVRALAVAILAVAVGAAAFTLATGMIGSALAALATGALAALILCGATVGRNSPGAADNASGVATVMAAASLMPDGFPLGVLLTSAEELALAGALAWATSEGGRASKTRSGIAINIDTVDDHGELRCMTHGRRSSALAQHVRRSLAAAGRQLRVHPLLPGVLTDGVALAQNEWSVVTLSRGNLRTLGRIHRPADSVRSIGGDGAGELARLLAHFLTGAGDPAS